MNVLVKTEFTCPACEDTGLDSRGNPCHPCVVNGRVVIEEPMDIDGQADLFGEVNDLA